MAAGAAVAVVGTVAVVGLLVHRMDSAVQAVGVAEVVPDQGNKVEAAVAEVGSSTWWWRAFVFTGSRSGCPSSFLLRLSLLALPFFATERWREGRGSERRE